MTGKRELSVAHPQTFEALCNSFKAQCLAMMERGNDPSIIGGAMMCEAADLLEQSVGPAAAAGMFNDTARILQEQTEGGRA